MAEEQQEPTAEAIKQRKKREKDAAKKAALGIERFTVEVAGVFKPDIKRLLKEHGFNNQQEVYQNLLRNVIAADFDTAAQMLRCVTTPYEPSKKMSRAFRTESLRELHGMQGDPEDEFSEPPA
jgi:virulence-associated protein VapD